jgi:hypothetical protein
MDKIHPRTANLPLCPIQFKFQRQNHGVRLPLRRPSKHHQPLPLSLPRPRCVMDPTSLPLRPNHPKFRRRQTPGVRFLQLKSKMRLPPRRRRPSPPWKPTTSHSTLDLLERLLHLTFLLWLVPSPPPVFLFRKTFHAPTSGSNTTTKTTCRACLLPLPHPVLPKVKDCRSLDLLETKHLLHTTFLLLLVPSPPPVHRFRKTSLIRTSASISTTTKTTTVIHKTPLKLKPAPTHSAATPIAPMAMLLDGQVLQDGQLDRKTYIFSNIKRSITVKSGLTYVYSTRHLLRVSL